MLEINIDMSEIEALAGQFGQVAERMYDLTSLSLFRDDVDAFVRPAGQG
jgi:hypothetical protein